MAIVKLQNVRLAFPDLFTPDAKYKKFGAAFPIEPGSANCKVMQDAVAEAAKAKWGAKATGILEELKSKGRVSFQERPKTNANGEVYDGFEGMYHANATNDVRPAVIDKDTSPLTAQDGKPYAGCYVDASVEIWAQDNSWGKRVNVTLRWVQFRADGDAFSGGAPVSQDEFESIAEGASAEGLV
jgi:hypothetical protein